MEDKIKNTIIIAILAFFLIIASAIFGELNKKPEKKVDLKKDKPQQAAIPPQTAQQAPPPTGANQPVADASISGTDSITTSNYANQTLSYFYYIPQSVSQNKQARHPYLILIPGIGKQGQDFTTQTFKDFANQYGFVILAPSFTFDEKNRQSKTSYQYPAAWSGRAFNDILNSFDSKQGLLPSNIYMLGFSTGAQFVSRYALLYPDYVTACAVNAAGEVDSPTKYQDTKFYIAVGSQDAADRKQTAQKFYNLLLQQKIDATYKEYPNVAHQISDAEIKDELMFFSRINSGAKGE